ncbi:MAG: Clp protease ClpP [Alistipes sp.]|nr:Clp protease ClpP [Alistipes sp.]
MRQIRITDREDATCLIEIEGVIGVAEEWQFDGPDSRVATYEKFRAEVERIRAVEADRVRVDIRSTGGDVNDALMIYEALRSLDAEVTTCCYGYTASAATIVAQAASEGRRLMSANALYLIHNSICAVEGNAAEIGGSVELLRKTDERLAEVYASRSGRAAGEFAALMAENNGNGRWLSPDEALAAGLVDEIVGAQPGGGTLAGNVVRALGSLFRRGTPPPAAQCSIFRLEEPFPHEEPAGGVAFDEGQRTVAATATRPTEDPSIADPCLSPNARAYAEDARRINKG